MSLRIRHQILERPYKRHSVEIISVDAFTRMARKLEKSLSERQHLKNLLNKEIRYSLPLKDFIRVNHVFWLEKL